jgi:7-keto-8-aminopelargonate synthetase-like enzyme
MFPVMPRDKPQLRMCLSAAHSEADILGLVKTLKELGA